MTPAADLRGPFEKGRAHSGTRLPGSFYPLRVWGAVQVIQPVPGGHRLPMLREFPQNQKRGVSHPRGGRND